MSELPTPVEIESLPAVVDAADSLYTLLTLLIVRQPRDISMTTASTLATLRREGPTRITALATAQGVTQPSMTALIASLEKSGMVVRRTDPDDRRASLIELTDAGLERSIARRRDATDRIAGYLAQLPNDQREVLLAAIPALRRLEQIVRG
ncbi:MarR family transcriptional regulator [Gordonia sp. TBRC 11910]|uniref:MarR family transcriptional regulator n=1 Tax=Gordonia asplenii TaxID=2725283 RepID=A0A848KXS1_9ACTN|nr:MarR family transcriptional regulator [Gordonia asplenii]NMO03544.1 MarR family transcriptional regulator [Gordonia asplenii]